MTLSPGWIFVVLCALMLLSGILAALVLALLTLSRAKLASEIDPDESSSHAARLAAIERDPEGHAAALGILRIFLNLVIGLGFVYWVAGVRGQPFPTADSVLIGISVGTIMIWISSQVIPMGIANHAGERMISMCSGPIRILHATLYPMLVTVRFFDEVVRRLAGTQPEPAHDAINSEILSVVSEGQRVGHIDETERDMLEAVVEFRSTLVESIMTPRTEICALAYTDDLGVVQGFIDEEGHSRVPVYEENLDHIRGMLYAKDLLRWITQHGNNGKPFVLADILRDPTFVPETKTVRELLAQLLADKVHIAMILDEYGGTSGLVTIEDIVEEIFGEIQDEYEDPEDEVGGVEVDPESKCAVIDARTEIDDANDELETLGIELPESDDYDTVAGFINTTLGRIPDVGEVFTTEQLAIEILEAEPTRVTRLRVSIAPTDQGDSEHAPETNAK